MTSFLETANSYIELARYGPLTFNNTFSIEEFVNLAERFPDLRMERSKNGKVTCMCPVKKGSGSRESIIVAYVTMWALENDLGEAYSPSVGILLPTGAIKSPDASWISNERLSQLEENADEEFLKAVPDFAVEIRSSTDSLKKTKQKMENVWMANGVRLAWLIDPYSEKVWIYRTGQDTEVVKGFKGRKLSGEEVLPGLIVPLDKIRKGVRKKK